MVIWWQVLGVAPSAAPREIKRAYAALIKQFRPDSHPVEFARIREAYEIGTRHAAQREAMEGAVVEEVPAEEAVAAGDEVATEVEVEVGVGVEVEVEVQAIDAVESRPEPVNVAAPATEPAPADAPAAEPAPAPARERAPEPVVGPEPADEPEPEPSRPRTPLDEVRALHELWQRAGEPAAFERLQALLEASRHGPIDARQDLEVALLQWFFGVEGPPQRLMFEAGRAFDWHRHDHVLRDLLGPERLQRLGLMLAASRDHAYGRASSNPWLRQVLAPETASRPPWFGVLPQVLLARAWVSHWLAHCRAASLPVGPELMSITTWRRMDRVPLLSTDLLFGLFAALFSLPSLLVDEAGLAEWIVRPGLLLLVTAMAAAGARFVLRWVTSRPRVEAGYARWCRWPLRHHAVGVFVVAYAIAVVAAAANLDDEMPRHAFFVLGGLAIALVSISMLTVLWRLVGAIECRVAAGWFERRDSLDRLAFQALLGAPREPLALPHRRFGDRASRRAAQALALQERGRGERPGPVGMPAMRIGPVVPAAAPKPPAAAPAPGGRSTASWLRWGFFALWIVVQAAQHLSSR